MTLTIKSDRLLKNMAEVNEIGRTSDNGVSRLAWGANDIAARMWFEHTVKREKFFYKQDGAGNQFAYLKAADSHTHTPRKVLLCGSHLDSVQNGGRFDGALGVLAGLEALCTLRDAEIVLPVDVAVVNFTDEEGTILGLFGSTALSGQLSADALANPRGGREALQAGMARLGISAESAQAARWQPDDLLAFVELHIEQGTRLEKTGTDIGVVTGIVGNRSLWLTFHGQAAHAGTQPLVERRDALYGAAAFVLQAPPVVQEKYHPGVMNCGQLTVEPGAFNIVPSSVQLALEIRHGSEQLLDAMQQELTALAEQLAAEYQLTLDVEVRNRCVAAPSAEPIMQAIEAACDTLGLSRQRMMSFAGHDAQSLATITPTAMLFAPSVAGISHHYDEFTHEQDVLNSANCLLHTLLNTALSYLPPSGGD